MHFMPFPVETLRGFHLRCNLGPGPWRLVIFMDLGMSTVTSFEQAGGLRALSVFRSGSGKHPTGKDSEIPGIAATRNGEVGQNSYCLDIQGHTSEQFDQPTGGPTLTFWILGEQAMRINRGDGTWTFILDCVPLKSVQCHDGVCKQSKSGTVSVIPGSSSLPPGPGKNIGPPLSVGSVARRASMADTNLQVGVILRS